MIFVYYYNYKQVSYLWKTRNNKHKEPKMKKYIFKELLTSTSTLAMIAIVALSNAIYIPKKGGVAKGISCFTAART